MKLPYYIDFCKVMAIGLWLTLGMSSCSKSGFLGKQPNTDSVVPSTLSDFQAILDNTSVFVGTPMLGEQSADNYVLNYSTWNNLDTKEHNAYVWAPDIYEGLGTIYDWNYPYSQVLYANVVLEGLSKLKTDSINNDSTWRAIKGQALFLRAFAFWNVSQVFAKPYDQATANSDLGIPLRLSPEINTSSVRASLQATYDRILKDLSTATSLLPQNVQQTNLNRPMLPAAYAMLARVYLSMRDYNHAGQYADKSLDLDNKLIDFDSVIASNANFPFPSTNKEIIYSNNFISSDQQILYGVINPLVMADSILFNSYDSNDLRKKFFFRASGSFRAGYNGYIFPFSGLATDEVLLMRAECRVRTGDVNGGLQDLDTLLNYRWVGHNAPPVITTDPAVALDSVLVHRRKELPMRGLRWMDLRRLNKEGRNIVIVRSLSGVIYTLQPNSNLYVLPIPPDVLSLSNLMLDNPRP